jgi:hypothetical protein
MEVTQLDGLPPFCRSGPNQNSRETAVQGIAMPPAPPGCAIPFRRQARAAAVSARTISTLPAGVVN